MQVGSVWPCVRRPRPRGVSRQGSPVGLLLVAASDCLVEECVVILTLQALDVYGGPVVSRREPSRLRMPGCGIATTT